MSDMITEALLEMHYHKAIINAFSSVFGAKFLKILKPSPKKESWVGFDQGWVSTSLTQDEFFKKLRDEIQNRTQTIDKFYFGYFLQFKRVEIRHRNTRFMPSGYNTPYYRSELSLKANNTTGLSQHETLLILNNVKNAEVDYCCPMIFDLDEMYEEPDINKLRIIPINESPTGWATNDRHFITFQNPNDPNPIWQSDPSEGKSFLFKDWISEEFKKGPSPMKPEEIYNLVNDSINILTKKVMEFNKQFQTRIDKKEPLNILPECMTIIQFQSL